MGSTIAVNSSAALSGWHRNGEGRRKGKPAIGLSAAAILHGIALWLVLNGTVSIPRTPELPPIIAQILPAPESAPRKPPDPVKQISPAAPRVPQSVAQAPEMRPEISDATPVISSAVPIPTAADTPAEQSGEIRSGAATGPRGFGSITNRSACIAAFAESFPREARRSRQEGSVTIAARIGADGRVLGAEIIASNPRRVFDRAALSVLNSGACRFEPDTADYDWRAEISYRLQGETAD
ncbi:MAG: energy transducer TonB [Betaproteobacteria bacterium]|nr:energy transducer TonB [Betaproteobacteria bacterium]